MLKVLILVCAAAIPRADCHEDTARIVMQGPDATNEIACGMQSQAYFAGTGLELAEEEYLKILCRGQRRTIVSTD